MIPTNVMSFMKKMVAAEETGGVPATDSGGTFGKLRQTLSSSLLTAQDKVTKMSPRPSLVPEVEAAETPPPAAPPPAAPTNKADREPGKPPSRAGACRVCLKTFKPGDVCHTCCECQHRVCEDCASYYKPDENQDPSEWRCSVCRRKIASRLPAVAQDSMDSLLDVPALEALQRRHSEARLGTGIVGPGSGGGALAPPRSPELRRHSDVSPASLKELEKPEEIVVPRTSAREDASFLPTYKTNHLRSMEDLTSLKGAGTVSKATSGESVDWRRGSAGAGVPAPSPTQLAQAAAAANRRRSIRPTRQRSCDGDEAGTPPARPAGSTGGQDPALGLPAPIPRRASAYDVLTNQATAGAGGPAAGISRRSSFRGTPGAGEGFPSEPTSQPTVLAVDEDRRMRRRGSQLPDISALQRGGGLSRMVGPRTSDGDDGAAMSAAAALAAEASARAARQLSVDGEAIKIVIHDVDSSARRRIVLRRDPTDKSQRTRGFGMRVVGGKPGQDNHLYAVIVWTVPGGVAEVSGLQQGDRIIEWSGVNLMDRSFEEVCSVMDRSSSADVIDLLVEQLEGKSDGTPDEQHTLSSIGSRKSDIPTVGLVIEPDTDKSPSSPTRRKLPKTPEQIARERAMSGRAQLQVWYHGERKELVVALMAADELPARDENLGYGGEPEAFAKLKLLPTLDSNPPMDTDVASATCNPIWNAMLTFSGITGEQLMDRSIEVTLWDACPGVEALFLGECTVDLEKAFLDDRAVWYRLEDPRGMRGRSPGTSPRGSIAEGGRSLRRGDFAGQRSISDDVDSIGECQSLLHPDHAYVAGSRRGSSQSETLEQEVYELGKDFSRSLPGSRRSSFQQPGEKSGNDSSPCVSRAERRRSSCVRRDPDEILRSLRAVRGELGRTMSLTGSHSHGGARRTATGRKGSMWTVVPMSTAAGATPSSQLPLGPGQLPPKDTSLQPLAAEILLNMTMLKGNLEVEVVSARRVLGREGDAPDTYAKCYLRDGTKWLHKRKTRVVRRTTEPRFQQTLKYQATDALGRTLVAMLWQKSSGWDHNLALGGCEIALDRLNLPQCTQDWYPLYPAQSLGHAHEGGDIEPDGEADGDMSD